MTFIKRNFWDGYTLFEKIFFPALILLQVIAYCIAPDSAIGMVCGLAGVMCVVLTAKGKLISYLFNFIQILTYMYIVWGLGLYLEFYENVFYFITCIFGVFMWKKNMLMDENGATQVIAKKMDTLQWVVTIGAVILGTWCLGWVGKTYMNNTLPYYDAATNVLAIVAQLLLINRYREQWVCWIVIDLICITMFVILGQWSMVAMYIAWTANAVYGWFNWSKLNKVEVN